MKYSAVLAASLFVAHAVKGEDGAQISPPVGVAPISVPASSHLLVSLPFDPLGGNGLHIAGPANGDAVQLEVWDSYAQRFVVLHAGLGEWNAGAISSPEPLTSGNAFFISNGDTSVMRGYLYGLVPMAASRTQWVPPGLSLLGNPYAAIWEVSGEDALRLRRGDGVAPAAGEILELGEGAWYQYPLDDLASRVWARPYADAFASDSPVRIDGIAFSETGEVTLSGTGLAGIAVDVFRQERERDETFVMTEGWHKVGTVRPDAGGNWAWNTVVPGKPAYYFAAQYWGDGVDVDAEMTRHLANRRVEATVSAALSGVAGAGDGTRTAGEQRTGHAGALALGRSGRTGQAGTLRCKIFGAFE